MTHLKTTALLLVLLSSALVAPAYGGSWFYDRDSNVRLNFGSAPNPTPRQLRAKHSLHYPLISRSRNEQGSVRLNVSLTELGGVAVASVERSSGFQRLDSAALKYVTDWWGYPSTALNGQAIPPNIQLDVDFRLVNRDTLVDIVPRANSEPQIVWAR